FQHRAGITPYTSSCDLAECCVFGKQSLPPFLCNPLRLLLYRVTYGGRTFSRSYGTIFPSSFDRLLSSPLLSSTRPPEAVCGTVTIAINSAGAFLGSLGLPSSWPQSGLLITSRA